MQRVPRPAGRVRGAAPRPRRLLKKAGENFSPLYPIDFFEMLNRRTVKLLCAGLPCKLKNKISELEIEDFYAVFLYFNGFAVLAEAGFPYFLIRAADTVYPEKNTKQYHR